MYSPPGSRTARMSAGAIPNSKSVVDGRASRTCWLNRTRMGREQLRHESVPPDIVGSGSYIRPHQLHDPRTANNSQVSGSESVGTLDNNCATVSVRSTSITATGPIG